MRRRFLLHVLLISILCLLTSAIAVQQAWVAKYSNGPGTTNQVVAMALDKDGNIYVAGHSTRTNAPYDFDYVVIKYNSIGAQQWANQFGLAGAHDQVSAMVISTNGDVFLTGSNETVKYFTSGLLAWSAPYGGRSMTLDSDGNSYITGFLTNDFSLVKLDAFGSNIWLRTWDRSGYSDISEAIAIDNDRNVFIAGLVSVNCHISCDRQAYIVKYTSAGELLWSTLFSQGYLTLLSKFNGFSCDDQGYLYAALKRAPGSACCSWGIRKLDPAGGLVWTAGLSPFDGEGVRAMCLDTHANVYTTGALTTQAYKTYKLTKDGTNVWEAEYGPGSTGGHRAYAVAVDTGGNVYVTGQSGVNTGNDYATIKYGTNGQQLWVKRYTEAGDSDDQAHAIAVSPNGDVYVTGFSNPSPGTYEITTIKYVQIAPIEKKNNGNILLSFCGAPGSNYVIEACSTLTNWTNIGMTTAGPSGLYTFEDTNAPSFQQRFYRTRQK